jgi:glutamine synthetase
VLRSPDPESNPYLSFILMIYAALDGIRRNLSLDAAESDVTNLPMTLKAARDLALSSDFIRSHVPGEILGVYPD